MMVQLTDEQRKIVAHDFGPALVFAVAGSGKTTAMVHRIARLVSDGVFAPQHILATSFSKAAVNDIRRALGRWDFCRKVRVSTLHALGYRVVMRARQVGLLQLSDTAATELENKAHHILNRTIAHARKEKLPFARELDQLDRDDFLSYVSSCKGNLKYADRDAVQLPPHAAVLAQQADAPEDLAWYLDLYKLFESLRQEWRLVTFDDMLMTAWELLVRHERLCQEFQAQHRCVLVDEFQDVNLVQSELLHLLTAPHHHMMVIGDDDQTIYEWRGATPQFILGFSEKYDAAKFIIRDNFRCKASHIVLANRVIAHNQQREPKKLSLTRGFAGQTFLHRADSALEMAAALVSEVERARERDVPLRDMAVLVRFYAQTPYIEQFLIEKQIPYQVIGNPPFYQRPEIQVLLAYMRLAVLNHKLEQGEALRDEEISQMRRLWRRVYNRPNRYISAVFADKVLFQVLSQQIPLSRALRICSAEASSRIVGRIDDLAALFQWLSSVLSQRPADWLLTQLEDELRYNRYLRRSSGFPETGEGRVQNVLAFIEYAKGRGSGVDLLEHIDTISCHKAKRSSRRGQEPDALVLMTVFRAKGLEWPLVFVPDCNEGIIPFRGNVANLEEERRLFYVALTRAKAELHLLAREDAELSRFLREADHEHILEAVSRVQVALEREPEAWDTQDVLSMARYAGMLNLERYFAFWWDAPESTKQWLAQRVQRLFQVAQQRGLTGALGLNPEEVSLWEAYGDAGEDEEEAFGDLEEFIVAHSPQHAQTHKLEEEKAPTDTQGESYQPGTKVKHPTFGQGLILEVTEVNARVRLTIDFDDVGVKKLVPHATRLEQIES